MASVPATALVPPPVATKVSRRRAAAATSRTSSEAGTVPEGVTSPRRSARRNQDVVDANASQLSLPQDPDRQAVATPRPATSTGGGVAAAAAAVTPKPPVQNDPPVKTGLWNAFLPKLTAKPQNEKKEESGGGGAVRLGTVMKNPVMPWLVTLAITAMGVGIALPMLGARPDGKAMPEGLSDVLKSVKDVDNRVEKLVKHLQAQVDAVDTTWKSEVDKVKGQLSSHKQAVDVRISELGKSQKGMGDKLSHLEGQVSGLLGRDPPLSRADIQALLPKLLDSRAAEGQGRLLNLDDVRAAARHVVMEELERYSADGIGLPDFALASAGAKVIGHSAVETQFSDAVKLVQSAVSAGFGPFLHPDAVRILKPGPGVPGSCLPLKGSNGTVDIRLAQTILPDAVTLEHVAKSVAYTITSAPRDFRVYGWQAPVESSPRLLGTFTYDIDNSNRVQTFRVAESLSAAPVNHVRLQVDSNHGFVSHTCIYRFRVHGVPHIQQTELSAMSA